MFRATRPLKSQFNGLSRRQEFFLHDSLTLHLWTSHCSSRDHFFFSFFPSLVHFRTVNPIRAYFFPFIISRNGHRVTGSRRTIGEGRSLTFYRLSVTIKDGALREGRRGREGDIACDGVCHFRVSPSGHFSHCISEGKPLLEMSTPTVLRSLQWTGNIFSIPSWSWITLRSSNLPSSFPLSSSFFFSQSSSTCVCRRPYPAFFLSLSAIHSNSPSNSTSIQLEKEENSAKRQLISCYNRSSP